MPEGPEVRVSSLYVNEICKGRAFTGEVVKSAVSKCSGVDFSSPRYSITSESRGKEMALTLECLKDTKNKIRVIFRFGMSGRFRFGPASEIHKHAHLMFFTHEEPRNVLMFVDVRRFGSWHVVAMEEGGKKEKEEVDPEEKWGENRGPDPMLQYALFRSHVLENLTDSIFNKPICEALLNQKFFNGIGNYLRAEILYRAKVTPFSAARDVLQPLRDETTSCPESHCPDLLQLCFVVPSEVVQMKVGFGKTLTCEVADEDYERFIAWLQCYENPGMNNLVDHNGRTIWFKGEAGPMAPKNRKSRWKRRKVVKEEDDAKREELEIKDVKLKEGKKNSRNASPGPQIQVGIKSKHQSKGVDVAALRKKKRNAISEEVEATPVQDGSAEFDQLPIAKRLRKRHTSTGH